MKHLFYPLLITFFIGISAAPLLASEPKTETVMGVVLDEEGNGIEVNEDLKPIDPYYNYISYKRVPNVPVGTIIITTATLDEYGDWEERKDFPTHDRVTTEKLADYHRIQELDRKITKIIWEAK